MSCLERGRSTDLPQLAAQLPDYSPPICRIFDQNDEAVTSRLYDADLRAKLDEIYNSAFWRSKARFVALRRRLNSTATLACGWDTYGAEPPNEVARSLARKILDVLEADLLHPTHLMPSAEGGIAISFVKGDNRAEIEIYNTGEIAAATYSGRSEPIAWDLMNTESALKNAVVEIRVRLAA